MVGVLEQLGALGGLNQGLLQAPGNGNLEQQQVLQQYAKALLNPNKQSLIDSQARGSNPYSLVHPTAGLADVMNALAGRRMLRNTFDNRNQNELNPGVNVIPPSGPQSVPTPRPSTIPPVDPNSVPVQPPFNGAPDGGADNNAQPESTSFGGEFNAPIAPRPVQPNAQPAPNADPRPTNVNAHTNDDIAALVQAGYPAHSASALADRRLAESGSNYHAVNPNDSGRISAGGLQWNRERLRGLFQHASENNIRLPAGNLNDPRYVSQAVAMIPPDVQRSYMIHELNTTEREAGEALRRARNPHEAYAAVMRFVRPANQSITPAMTSRVANLAANFRGPTANNGVPAPNTSIPRPPTQASIEADEPPPGVTWTGRAGLGGADLIPAADTSNSSPTPNNEMPRGRTAEGRPLVPGTTFPLYNPSTDNMATHPSTTPSNFGLSPREMQSLNYMSPENRQMTMQNLERQYTPQYTDGVGGRRWVIPRTGESGWIPNPRYGTFQAGNGATFETITIHGPNGSRQTYILNPQSRDPAQRVPRDPNSATAPLNANPPPSPDLPQPEAGSLGKLPGTPEIETSPGRFSNPGLSPIADEGTDKLGSKNPNLINAQTEPTELPPNDQASPLQHPLAIESRNIAREQERLSAEAGKLGTSDAQVITDIRDRGQAALETRQILRELEAIEALPGINSVVTGPMSEYVLGAHQNINSALRAMGVRQVAPEVMSAAEALRSLNIRLSSPSARQLTNRPTQFDFQQFLASNPGLVMSREGRQLAVAFLRNQSDIAIELDRVTRQPGVNSTNISQTQDRIMNNHRLVSPDGTVLDHTVRPNSWSNGRFAFPREPVVGQIIQNRQWDGRNWAYVNANDQSTWVAPLPTTNRNAVPISGNRP